MTPKFLQSRARFHDVITYALGDPPKTGREVVYVGACGYYRPETADLEMEAGLRRSTRSRKPARSLVIAYPAGVQVNADMAISDAHRISPFLDAKRYVLALHKANGKYDAHIIWSSVDDTGKTARSSFSLSPVVRICAIICQERNWPVPKNKYIAKSTSLQKNHPDTRASAYAQRIGEIPWNEAIYHFVRHAMLQAQGWIHFITNLNDRGIAIRLDKKVYRDGIERTNLRYSLTNYPKYGASAPSIGHDMCFGALNARWGELPKNYRLYIQAPHVRTPQPKRGLYRAAGRVLEESVIAGEGIVTDPEVREVIIARRKLRDDWAMFRRIGRARYLYWHESAWAIEQECRRSETKQRLEFKRSEAARIRNLPAATRQQERMTLTETLRAWRRRDRTNASLRWRRHKAEFSAREPFLDLNFLDLTAKRAANGSKDAIILHRHHIQRGLIAQQAPQKTSIPPVPAQQTTRGPALRRPTIGTLRGQSA